MFNKIDMQSWNRRESYNHYFDNVPCTYSMTVNLDVTGFLEAVRHRGLKFFPVMLFAISQIVNAHKEFRMDLDEDGCVGYYDYSNPCYAVFHDETETITNVWTEYSVDLGVFVDSYNDDMSRYKNECRSSKPLEGKNYFNVSCIPWTCFTGFNLNLQKGYEYLLPIFTIGKYFSDGEKVMLPLAIQVHHAVCDGFHVARFVNELQQYLNSFSSEQDTQV